MTWRRRLRLGSALNLQNQRVSDELNRSEVDSSGGRLPEASWLAEGDDG